MSTKNSNFLGCRVNNERYQEVKQRCEDEGRTVNDFLREIIDNEINGSSAETSESISMEPAETYKERFAKFASEVENGSSPLETFKNQYVSEEDNNGSSGEPLEQDEEEPEELDNSTIKQIISHSLCVILGVCLVVNGADLSALGIKGRFIKG